MLLPPPRPTPHAPRLSTLLLGSFLTAGLITTVSQGLLTLARSTFPAVQKAPAEDIVVQGCHPHYPTMGTSIEMSKEIWEACCARVTHVTFVVKSGASQWHHTTTTQLSLTGTSHQRNQNPLASRRFHHHINPQIQ